MKLYKKINKVVSKKDNVVLKDDKGNDIYRTFTNFYVEIQVNDNTILIPIQPVNFGESSNRRNYSLLSMSA